jgi:dephospho-CoA kinase
MSAEQVKAIMATQASRSARMAIADDVIKNDAGLEHLMQEVVRLDAQYRKLAREF